MTTSIGGNAASITPPPLGASLLPDLTLHPLPAIQRRWTAWAGGLVSLAILAAAIVRLRGTAVADMAEHLPHGVLFWTVFVLAYVATPGSEWVIFRRLWSIPSSGFVALLRKRVTNELVLGYLGEVYFYAWVRRTGLITRSAPFGAIKDVAILSALAGNVMTLAMLAAAAPFFSLLQLGIGGRALLGSLGIVALSSLAMLVLRRHLFTLPRADLAGITTVHLIRVTAMLGLTAMLWHLALPSVGLAWWLLLSTLRQLLSRLPLVPNKDIAFVGVAVFATGSHTDIATVVALVGSLTLVAHLLVAAVLGGVGLFERGQAA
ncbi:MAG: hypothetical protein ACTHMG_16415 [Sphingomonas sp.]